MAMVNIRDSTQGVVKIQDTISVRQSIDRQGLAGARTLALDKLEKNFYLGLIKYLKVVGERYKVKAILRYKSIKNEFYYKVKQLGQPAKDSIQELVDYLNNCK